MEAREFSPGNKTWTVPVTKRQSELVDNGDQTCCLSQRDDESLSSTHLGQNYVANGNDADNESIGDQTEDNSAQQIANDGVHKYQGLRALHELANTARVASSTKTQRTAEVTFLTDNRNPLNDHSETFLENIKDGSDAIKTGEVCASTDTSASSRQQLLSGPLTRGARKTLEAALAKSLLQRIPPATTKTTVIPSSASSSVDLPPSLAVIVPSASSSAQCDEVGTSESFSILIKSSPEPLSSPRSISTACQCSPSTPTLSSPQLPSSLFDMSNSFLTSEDCTHNDDVDGERGRCSSSPSRWDFCHKTATMAEDDLDNHNDMVNFITDAMDSSVCGAVDDDELDKNDTDSEWVMDTNGPTSPPTPNSEISELKLPETTPVAVSRSDATSLEYGRSTSFACLLITEDDDGRLKRNIHEAVQTTSVQTATSAEAVALCNKETFDLIWVRVPVPVKEELLTVVATVRCSNGESKGARIIAVADKTLLVDLLLRLFDDVFLEPLPVMTIRQKYARLYRSKKCTDNSEVDKELRDLNTPESSLSFESMKSQSTPPDSDMDFTDLSLPPLKHNPSVAHQKSSTLTLSKRVRIKDSCDQLRKLLPYVRGRKTDMASILEMTVDYLQIVNASLPQEFQTRVIEMLSPDLPILDGRIKRDSISSAVKGNTKLINPLPLSKPVYVSGKSDEGQTATSTSTSHNLNNNDNLNNHKNDNKNNNSGISVTGVSTNRMTTRSQASKTSSKCTQYMISCSPNGDRQAKTDANLFADTFVSQQAKSDSNANTLDVVSGDKKPDSVAKPFHKRELPLNVNIVGSNPKRPHMIVTSKSIDSQPPVYLPSGAIVSSKSKTESVFDNASNQTHRLSGIQFPHMFTEGDISANRMFSTGHVSGNDVFPYQTHSYLSTSGPARFPGVSSEGGEVVASVNNMFFDAAYYCYPSLHDSSNGNYFINNGGQNEYVNPNAVLPMTSNSASRITNFNLGRRYERLSVSGETERFSETAIGSVSLQHQ